MSSAITVKINKKECDLCPDERSSGWLRCCLCERFQGNLNICKSAWKHENVQFFQFAGFLSVLDMVMHMLWNLSNFNIYFKWTSFVVRNFCSFSEYFWCCFPNLEEGTSFLFRLFSGIVPRVTWISIGGAIFLGIYDKARMVVQDTFWLWNNKQPQGIILFVDMAKRVHSHFLRQALLALAFILEVDILEYWSLLVEDHPGNIWGWYAGICVCVSVCVSGLSAEDGGKHEHVVWRCVCERRSEK